MPQLSLPCPHCNAEKIGFAPRGSAPVRPGIPKTLLFLQCEGCGQGIIAVVQNTLVSVGNWISGGTAELGSIGLMYPRPEPLECPADVPRNVASAFLSGVDNLGRANGSNAAAAMFRRAIELAARHVDPTAPTGINLKGRIERLSDTLVTPSMKEWAQHIRLEGNDAVHGPEEYSDRDAKDLRTFAELFLTYAFTLPAMLKKAYPESETGIEKPKAG